MLNCEVVWLDTMPIRGGGGNTQIVAAWVPYKTVVPTMLFSHGNAVDLGQMLPFYRFKLCYGTKPIMSIDAMRNTFILNGCRCQQYDYSLRGCDYAPALGGA